MNQKKILNEKEERTRSEKLMGIIKTLLDTLVDGTKAESLGNNIINYFGIFTSSFQEILPEAGNSWIRNFISNLKLIEWVLTPLEC